MGYDFVEVSVRGTEEDKQKWRNEARALNMKFGDYLRHKIDAPHVVSVDCQKQQTHGRVERSTSAAPRDTKE